MKYNELHVFNLNMQIDMSEDVEVEEDVRNLFSDFHNSSKHLRHEKNICSRLFNSIKRILNAPGVSWIPYILICLFGMSAWVALNGLWSELPALVPVLPEGERLPSILVITTQIGNVGPLIFVIISRIISFVKKRRVDLEVPGVFVIILIGITACILLGIFWDHEAVVFGKTHSVPLLILSFFLSIMDCTSTLVYIPYMERFPEEYISALFIGEGLGGFFPSLMALIQGAYKQHSDNGTNSSIINETMYSVTENDTSTCNDCGLLFSQDVYFVLLAVMIAISGVAFIFLNWLPLSKRLMVRRVDMPPKEKLHFTSSPCLSNDSSPLNHISSGPSSSDNSGIFDHAESSPLILTQQDDKEPLWPHISEIFRKITVSPRTKELLKLTDLFLQLGWLNFLSNSAISAVSVYVFMPYGTHTYNLAINLGNAVNPMSAFIAMFLPCQSRIITLLWTTVASIFGITIIVLAATAPESLPMVDSGWGSFIVVSLLECINSLSHGNVVASMSCFVFTDSYQCSYYSSFDLYQSEHCSHIKRLWQGCTCDLWR